jgi:hypothetical protein
VAWFKVDDRLHDHYKARRVRRSHYDKRRDVAPFGLWVLAGSWCGSNPTEGFIPLEVLEEWDDSAHEYAERLIKAGLWIKDEVAGEPGYRFHDWHDQNPQAAQDSSAYGKRGNHVRWHEKEGKTDPECEFCAPESGDTSGATRGDTRGDSGGESSRPVPTRPDPTQKDDGFAEFWALYPRKAGKGQAVKAWKAATKKADAAAILAGLRLQLPTLALGRKTDGDYRPFPATWLNGERWADEVAAIAAASTPGDQWSRAVVIGGGS